MVRALITGISGFAGSYLAEYLLSHTSIEVWGVSLGPTDNIDALMQRIVYLSKDITDPAVCQEVMQQAQPDLIFHLAAQAFVPVSWQDPWSTMENNIRAQVNLLHFAVQQSSTARVLVIGSNEEYGRVDPEQMPITEETPLRPDSPYGVSKIAQDYLGLQYFISHKLYSVRLRPFNHIGPRQNDRFMAADFAKQVAEIELGRLEPVIRVGNLESKRDFTDVRDMARAYALALERGAPGEVYNVGSGQAHAVREVLDYYLRQATLPIRVEQDPSRSRLSDTPITVCDATKFRKQTGWTPEIPFEQTLQDTLEYWRERVRQVDR